MFGEEATAIRLAETARSRVTAAELCHAGFPALAFDRDPRPPGLLRLIVDRAREFGDEQTATRALARLMVTAEFREHLHLLPAAVLAEVLETGRPAFGPGVYASDFKG